MKRLRTLLPVLFLLAAPAFAGWSMTQVTTSSGPGEGLDLVQKIWMDGTAAKVEFMSSDNPMMEPGSYLLIQEGGKNVFMVNPKQKTYARFDIMALGEGMTGAMSGMGMEMKIVDPKMEKLLEEPGGLMLGLPTTHYRFHTSYTMNMSMPMGMKMQVPTDAVEDVWVTSALGVGGAGEAMAAMAKSGGGGAPQELMQLTQRVRGTMVGLPLKQVTVTKTSTSSKGGGAMRMLMRHGGGGGGGETSSTTTMVVKDLVEVTLPASTFKIPAGYVESEILQRGPAMPDMNDTAMPDLGEEEN